MRRGEIWTVAGGPEYTGKPRPVVIVQDDRFDATTSLTISAFTTDPTQAPLFRRHQTKSAEWIESRFLLDGGQDHDRPEGKAWNSYRPLADQDIVRLNRALLVFLGLAGPC